MVRHHNFLLNRVDPPSLARMMPHMNVLHLDRAKFSPRPISRY
jgi:hypothetical protein